MHTYIHTHPCTRTHLHLDYSLSTPLEQSRGANCVATASQTCLEAAGQSQMAQALAYPRCQQAPLALSARLPPERGEEMVSQIESHLITYSLGLQLSRRWREWGPCHLCGWPSWTVVNWNLIYLSPYLAHYQSNSKLGLILENWKRAPSFTFLHLPQLTLCSPVMQFTELLICLRAVNMVHRWRCSRMVRADHRAQFDGKLVYHALTLAEVHNAALLQIPASHRGDARWGYRQWRCIYTKSCLTVQRPSGYSTFHFTLLIFHILAPATLWPNASAWVAGIWMRVHIYPFTWMSDGSSSKQYTSPPATSPLLTSPGPKIAC